MIKIEEQWDYHKSYKYILIEDNKVIYSFELKEFGNNSKLNDIILESVYIQPEHRGKNYFYNIMNYVFEEVENMNYGDIWILVFNKNFIVDKYKKLGFKFYDKKNKEFSWYKYDRVATTNC